MITAASLNTHLIAGELREGGSQRINVVNPATEQVIGSIPAGTSEDVDDAVSAAAQAFPAWSSIPLARRVDLVRAIADQIELRRDEIAATMTAEMGCTITFANKTQTRIPVLTIRALVDLFDSGYSLEESIGNSLVIREPIGVIGAITPWNFPLHQVVNKVIPALVAGNTVVLKPSEMAPLTAGIFAHILQQVGLPEGVFNLVHGTGDVVGEAISAHPGIDMVSFTGSTRAGRLVTKAAADTVKRVALELGGKSANVVLADADVSVAVKIGLASCYINGGQTCSALTRLLVPAALYDEAVALAAEGSAKYTVGDPTKAETRIGPLASATQKQRVLHYLQVGTDEGARLVAGGPDAPNLPETGAYVAPAVFADVTPEMTIAQEEIFGPVLTVIAYQDEDDAVRIANSTLYGLSAGVQSTDLEHATSVAKRLRAGQVDINGGKYNPAAPFGGYRQSGNGRELGRFGLEEFTEVKSIQ